MLRADTLHKISETSHRYDLSHIKQLASAGAVASPQLIARLSQRFPKATIISVFGMTETVGMISLTSPTAVIYAHSQVRIVSTTELDEDGNMRLLKLGESGEIQVKGPCVFCGYLGDKEGTEGAFTKDGWLRTGDLGHFVPKTAELRITGRLKDVIIRGGAKIWPAGLLPDLLIACGLFTLFTIRHGSYPRHAPRNQRVSGYRNTRSPAR